MLIAVLSDIHDNIWNLSDALDKLREVGAEALLFCGDFCAPFTLAQLGRDFQGPVNAVFGNNDGDPRLLVQIAQAAGNVTLHGQHAELTLAGRRIAINHYPEIARQIAAGGNFDLVCYGHDHQSYVGEVGRTLLANPGEVMGRFGEPTFGLYDCESGQFALQAVRHFPRHGGAN
jgi:putative phosphoesterase